MRGKKEERKERGMGGGKKGGRKKEKVEERRTRGRVRVEGEEKNQNSWGLLTWEDSMRVK